MFDGDGGGGFGGDGFGGDPGFSTGFVGFGFGDSSGAEGGGGDGSANLGDTSPAFTVVFADALPADFSADVAPDPTDLPSDVVFADAPPGISPSQAISALTGVLSAAHGNPAALAAAFSAVSDALSGTVGNDGDAGAGMAAPTGGDGPGESFTIDPALIGVATVTPKTGKVSNVAPKVKSTNPFIKFVDDVLDAVGDTVNDTIGVVKNAKL